MTSIATTLIGPGHVGIELRDGNTVTHHEVVVDGNLLDDMALFDVDTRLVAEETVRFLLDRHAATELPERISIRDVDRMEPEYRDELRVRLA